MFTARLADQVNERLWAKQEERIWAGGQGRNRMAAGADGIEDDADTIEDGDDVIEDDGDELELVSPRPKFTAFDIAGVIKAELVSEGSGERCPPDVKAICLLVRRKGEDRVKVAGFITDWRTTIRRVSHHSMVHRELLNALVLKRLGAVVQVSFPSASHRL